MKEDVKALNEDMNRVTNLLSWLIDTPDDFVDMIVPAKQDKIWSKNYLRVRVVEIWVNEMKKRMGKKIGDPKSIRALDDFMDNCVTPNA